jgi:hypothetical protein
MTALKLVPCYTLTPPQQSAGQRGCRTAQHTSEAITRLEATTTHSRAEQQQGLHSTHQGSLKAKPATWLGQPKHSLASEGWRSGGIPCPCWELPAHCTPPARTAGLQRGHLRGSSCVVLQACFVQVLEDYKLRGVKAHLCDSLPQGLLSSSAWQSCEELLWLL